MTGGESRTVTEKGIKAKRTALDTLAQNSGSKRSRRVLITKAQTIRIETNLLTNIWPKVVKAARYISN